MFYEKNMPFYMTCPQPWLAEEVWEQDRDRQIMKSYYSGRAARLQELVEQECDWMEYDGSRMYDAYPDPWMLHRLCGKTEKKFSEEGGSLSDADGEDESLTDLIGVLLYNEMYRRRCRRRKCRSFF